ncbi:MAG: hypothetical protein ACI8QS_001783 [Planctomycetota bacterium]|jgi:hypothetical protein
MDFNDYWQENKRFVTTVAVGLVVFLIARQTLSSKFDGDIQASRRSISTSESKVRKIVHTSSDLADVQRENESLITAVETLAGGLRFLPRDDFSLQADAGSASNQYLRTLSRVREDLLLLANRGGLRLDDSLGMPKLSPTRDEEIERHLEALDAIDSVVRFAIDSGIDSIDRIQLRLDPGLGSRQGLGLIERTRVEFQMRGDSRSLLAVLTATQRALPAGVLPIDSLEVTPSSAKKEEVRMDMTLVLPRLSDDPVEEAKTDEAS